MNNRRFLTKLITAIILAVVFGVALYYRVIPAYEKVFVDSWIKFTSIDAYYHMRIIDNLVHNFPQMTQFDPYFIYPGGIEVAGAHFFDRLLAGIIWLIGVGNPSQTMVNTIGVYFPAILGALTVVPVYFIGRELFNRWVGLVAGILVGIIPGEFLGRSILGFTDHHVAEVFFTSTALMFLIFALKSAAGRDLKFGHFREWKMVKAPPVLYAAAAGVFLGIYFLTWAGALMFVLIVAVFVVIQIIINHLRGEPVEHLAVVSAVCMLITLIITALFPFSSFYIIPLVLALVVPPLLVALARWLAAGGRKPVMLPLITLGAAVAGGLIFWAVSPVLFTSMLKQFSILVPNPNTVATTSEMQPFFVELVTGYGFIAWPAWLNFSLNLFWSGIGLICVLLLAYRKQYRSETTLFLIWTLVMLLATASQRRFCYYLTINVGLLSGYFAVLVYVSIDSIVRAFAGGRYLRKSAWILSRIKFYAGMPTVVEAVPVRPDKKTVGAGAQSEQSKLYYRISGVLAAGAVVFFLVFAPYLGTLGSYSGYEKGKTEVSYTKTTQLAGQVSFAPSDAWYESLTWLKENTPEPFDVEDYYYRLVDAPPPGEEYLPPATAYGIFSWWDYGYWISSIAHRLPYTNPSQDPGPIAKTAGYFVCQDPSVAAGIIEESGSDYIIIDYDLTNTGNGKFWAIANLAGDNLENYAGIYYRTNEQGDVEPMMLYYPEYYRSMIVRLYNFDGKAVSASSVIVVSYESRQTRDGMTVRLLTGDWNFDTYEAAEQFVAGQDGGSYAIVGINPFVSIVSLEELTDYELVYASTQGMYTYFVNDAPEVKVFAYRGD
jgi:dolichyl-phosphooligosaccharide-protein glycotransferase